MSAPVRIEARAWGDLRFATLARLLGLVDADHALIKVARLWSWQTEHFTPDAPTYEVDADTIESVLGPGGPAAMVRARLAEETSTGYRIRGTEGQIEWCDNLSSKRQQAGRARADGARRDAKGRLMPHSSCEPGNNSPAKHPAPAQHASSAPPAKSSAPSPSPSPSPSPDPEDQSVPPARDPAVPGTTPEPILPASQERAEARRQLIGRAWDLAGAAFRELGRDGIEPHAFDPWAGMPGAADEGMKLLIKQVDRLFVGEPPDAARALATIARRIAVAVAEARAADPPTRRWVTPMRLWDPASFAKGAENSPEQVRPRGARASPKSNGATGRVEPPPPETFRRGDQKL